MLACHHHYSNNNSRFVLAVFRGSPKGEADPRPPHQWIRYCLFIAYFSNYKSMYAFTNQVKVSAVGIIQISTYLIISFNR